MSTATELRKLIKELSSGRFYIECPCCGEEIPLSKAGLFFLDNFTDQAKEAYETRLQKLKESFADLRARRKILPKRIQTTTQAVNIGFVLERLAPVLDTFRFAPGDCRSLFDPIDYVIFEGLSEKGKVSRILFGDIKSGKARLNQKQRAIKGVIEKGKVDFDTYEAAK